MCLGASVDKRIPDSCLFKDLKGIIKPQTYFLSCLVEAIKSKNPLKYYRWDLDQAEPNVPYYPTRPNLRLSLVVATEQFQLYASASDDPVNMNQNS